MENTNPYASPANDSATESNGKLYSPGHVAWATFLGAPIAGCVLLAINYRRLGNVAAANLACGIGFVGTAAMLVIAFFLPDNFPNSVLPTAYTFGMYQCANALQGNTFRRRLANGGSKASGWAATGIALLCLICICIVLFAVVIAVPDEWVGVEF